MPDTYVEYGPTQIARLIGPERAHRTNGYRIVPLKNGLFDGWGMSVWVSDITPVEVEAWLPCVGWPGEYRWHYDHRSNEWHKEVRKVEEC